MKKGQKFWTIRMNNKARYDVVPAVFERTDKLFPKSAYYRISFEYDGKSESLVVDIEDKDIFAKEKDALVECCRRCRQVALSWIEQGDCLAERMSKS